MLIILSRLFIAKVLFKGSKKFLQHSIPPHSFFAEMVLNEVYSLPLDAYLYKNLNIEISITEAS
jgi:hypothetical protein